MCALLVTARVTWHVAYLNMHSEYWMLMPGWIVTFGVTTVTLFISWFDKPYTVGPRQQRYIDSLNVTVAIPVYNEDAPLLDRCIYSLVNSSRPPQCVHAVFAGVFGHKIRQVRAITRDPILLSEVGVGQVAGQAAKSPGLLAGVARDNHAGLVWFDVAQHGGLYKQDWRLESHRAALAAFCQGLARLMTSRR